MTDLVIRPLSAGEEHLFDNLIDPAVPFFGNSYRTMADRGEYRPQWTWLALRDGVVVACAAWWARPDDPEPLSLDWFDFTDADAAVKLLRVAGHGGEYGLKLPSGWRDDPAVYAAANARINAAVAGGFTPLVERYRYRWTPDCGLPERPGRLEFRPEPGNDVILDVFRRFAEGSLDAHARRVIAESGVEAAAQEDLDFLLWMPSPRDWWRLAYTPGGELVGLAAPGRNHNDPVIGFIGVVPEQRGHGYAYDLLAEATHLLAAEGVDRIVASTDVPNLPMAKTFAKAGYPITEHRYDFV